MAKKCSSAKKAKCRTKQKVCNPLTGRCIKIGGSVYKNVFPYGHTSLSGVKNAGASGGINIAPTPPKNTPKLMDLLLSNNKNCQCNDFKWAPKSTRKISKDMKGALDLFTKRNNAIKVGKMLGSGQYSTAFAMSIEGRKDPCYSLLIRQRSPGQPGGIKSYSAAAATGAALPVLDHFVAKISPHTYDYIITQRLSYELNYMSLNNTAQGLKLQKQLVEAVRKLGQSQVVHGDEHTAGNIMVCEKDNKLYFIDFSDETYNGIPTHFSRIPKKLKQHREKLYNSLFEEYLVEMKCIRKYWPSFARDYSSLSKIISIMSLFNILGACVLEAAEHELSSYEPPELLIDGIHSFSEHKLSKENILALVYSV